MRKREFAMRMRKSDRLMRCDHFQKFSECENGFALPALVRSIPQAFSTFSSVRLSWGTIQQPLTVEIWNCYRLSRSNFKVIFWINHWSHRFEHQDILKRLTPTSTSDSLEVLFFVFIVHDSSQQVSMKIANKEITGPKKCSSDWIKPRTSGSMRYSQNSKVNSTLLEYQTLQSLWIGRAIDTHY